MSHIDIQKSFWKGTLVISGAALFVKVLSAFYRIPYQNIAGDLGLYVYQQVYPFYAIAFALSLYGFPLILSKMISEHADTRNVKEVLTTTLLGLSGIFVLVFFMLHQSAPFIGNLMSDPMLVGPLQVASYSFLFVPFLSVIRGFFQGKEEMAPTAISQVIEQFVRVSMILLFTIWLVMHGADQYEIGSAAIFGGLIGSLISVIVLIRFLRKETTGALFAKPRSFRQSTSLLTSILKGGVAICITAVMLALFQLVDALQVVHGLQEGGMELLDAKVTKGVFDRGQPLLQLGTVIATAMALPLIPSIAKAKRSGDRHRIMTFTWLSLKFSFILGGAAAVGLAVIILPTNIFLYEDGQGSTTLGLLGIAILFGSIAITSSAILQGLGKIGFPVLFISIALLMKVTLNIWMVPAYGITGAALTTVISTALVGLGNLIVVQRTTNVFRVQRFHSSKVMVSLILMAVTTFFWKELLIHLIDIDNRIFAGIIALTSAIIGAIVYIIALISQKVWQYDEINMIPKARFILRWIHRERKSENG